MNVKYWFEFKGLDEVLNRVEILTSASVVPEEIQGGADPFSLKYLTARKLDPVQGSQATLRLISRRIFEFTGLHTDDMQEYVIRFYRAGCLYWLGYLDSELYSENLSDYPPYPVEFAGADFNIMKRLKYRDAAGNRYTDIVPLITHLKRCFDLLGLPFDKLYIGCTTVANDVPAVAGETPLHVLYMMSSNFYDEDKEPMTCREVVESILQPFGLMMVQKGGSVFIYDYNTVKLGRPLKRYNFGSFAYEAEEAVNFNFGDISDLHTVSTDSSFGFEEMINNVQIRSSIYANNYNIKQSVKENDLSDLILEKTFDKYSEKQYRICGEWNANKYIVYRNKIGGHKIQGAVMSYEIPPNLTFSKMSFINRNSYIIKTKKEFYLNVKASVYLNTRENPFNEDEIENDERTRVLVLGCDLLLLDLDGNPKKFYGYTADIDRSWIPIEKFEPAAFDLYFSDMENETSRVANKWLTNSPNPGYMLRDGQFQNGTNIESPGEDGYIELRIRLAYISNDKPYLERYPVDKVKSLLIDNVEISLLSTDLTSFSTDDYLFKSYVNKKVATDYKDLTLKCISANEEQAPIGRANILKKIDNHYELQLSFIRESQTDILERLLMCTIHSNYTQKNISISATVKMSENPALTYCTYKNVIQSDGMYIEGAQLDFYNATTTISAVEFSADDARISDIPYD